MTKTPLILFPMQCWFLPDHVSPKRTIPRRTQTVPPFGGMSKSISGGSRLSQVSLMLTSPRTSSSLSALTVFFDLLISAADAAAARLNNAKPRAIVRMVRLLLSRRGELRSRITHLPVCSPGKRAYAVACTESTRSGTGAGGVLNDWRLGSCHTVARSRIDCEPAVDLVSGLYRPVGNRRRNDRSAYHRRR